MLSGNTANIDLDKPVVMAIINITPDSFFAESRNFTEDDIRSRIRKAMGEGADMLDIGGYSTRPGAVEIDPEEELRRVLSGVRCAVELAPDMPLSIDTFRASVARGVLARYSNCIINDISAGELDPEIINVVSDYGVPYIAMHMRGTPADMQTHADYKNVVEEVKSYLLERACYLRSRGVERVILDPGFGFAKTTEQNYTLLGGLDEICGEGYPVLAGVSRKSMIYKVLDSTPAESLHGTTALNWECLRKGAKILRVHDVAPAADAVKLFNYYSEHGK